MLSFAPNALAITTANLHLFGRLARIGEDQKETPLYYKDFKRVDAIIDYFRQRPGDILALQEVWDPILQRRIADGLKDIYPYRILSPWGSGVDGAIKAVGDALEIPTEELEQRSKSIVSKLAQNHYSVSQSTVWSLLMGAIPEDWTARLATAFFGVNDLWGAGLLFLSKHEISRDLSHTFVPHPKRVDLDRFTRKGVQNIVIVTPDMGPVRFLHTHLQEGQSKRAIKTRDAQLRAMRTMINESDFPTIALGDLNVERDERMREKNERRKQTRTSQQYDRMKDIIGLRDSYLHAIVDVHKDPGTTYFRRYLHDPGPTYLHGPFARKMGIPDTTDEKALVVDYVLHDGNFESIGATVENSGFYLDPSTPLSDHRPLSVLLQKKNFTGK